MLDATDAEGKPKILEQRLSKKDREKEQRAAFELMWRPLVAALMIPERSDAQMRWLRALIREQERARPPKDKSKKAPHRPTITRQRALHVLNTYNALRVWLSDAQAKLFLATSEAVSTGQISTILSMAKQLK
jgi:hypothetical protein